ncbi:MAG: hypothetical protein OXU71_00945 [Gammaproteobacteria bacterium]|nr:hypothetical protein [Gammaproteobacteria bacterium]
MYSIDIPSEIYERLESLARGFNDSPSNVIARLLHFHDARQHCQCDVMDEGEPSPVSVPDVTPPPRHGTRDYSRYALRYTFDGDRYEEGPYMKGPLVRAVAAAHVRCNPAITYAELCKDFPKELQGSYGVFRNIEEVRANRANRRWNGPDIRFSMKNPIKLADGTIVVVCTQWGNSGTKQNFPKFCNAAKNLGYHVTKD